MARIPHQIHFSSPGQAKQDLAKGYDQADGRRTEKKLSVYTETRIGIIWIACVQLFKWLPPQVSHWICILLRKKSELVVWALVQLICQGQFVNEWSNMDWLKSVVGGRAPCCQQEEKQKGLDGNHVLTDVLRTSIPSCLTNRCHMCACNSSCICILDCVDTVSMTMTWKCGLCKHYAFQDVFLKNINPSALDLILGLMTCFDSEQAWLQRKKLRVN